MTNKLRDELADKMCSLDNDGFSGLYYSQDYPQKAKDYYAAYADCVIDHIAPTMREVVGAGNNVFKWVEPIDFAANDYLHDLRKALASLSAWQENGG